MGVPTNSLPFFSWPVVDCSADSEVKTYGFLLTSALDQTASQVTELLHVVDAVDGVDHRQPPGGWHEGRHRGADSQARPASVLPGVEEHPHAAAVQAQPE